MAVDIGGFEVEVVGDNPDINKAIESFLGKHKEEITAKFIAAYRDMVLYGITPVEATKNG